MSYGVTVHEFIAKWRKVELKERSAAQGHFLDLCDVFGHSTPAAADPTGETFCFKRSLTPHAFGALDIPPAFLHAPQDEIAALVRLRPASWLYGPMPTEKRLPTV